MSIKDSTGQKVLESTRADEGSSGVPKAFVIGKGRRAPRGWELAVMGESYILLLGCDHLACMHANMSYSASSKWL